MNQKVFSAADILLPSNSDMEKWAVIACDQFSSDMDYWERVSAAAKDVPSTLHMVVPEAHLRGLTMEEAAVSRNAVMDKYLADGIFEKYENALVYVEREVTGGGIRRGLVGKLDLDAYEYTPGTTAPVRASEKTVVDRLPPRIAVREGAALEMPHVMVLIDDESRSIIEPLAAKKDSLPLLYDFELMEGGGRVEGRLVSGAEAESVLSGMDMLFDRPFAMVIGDGNHSLAAAKACWDAVKDSVPESEREGHPARYALIELNNVYDEGIVFEPIHRVVFGADPKALVESMKNTLGEGEGRAVRWYAGGEEGEINVPSASLGGLIGAVQNAIDVYISANGGTVDYIHDDAAARGFAEKPDTTALFLPKMDKGDLFATVEADGVFPKKSFSIGHARDKRY